MQRNDVTKVRSGLTVGLVVMLGYVAIRGSAAAWAPFEALPLSIGWAARCGGQVLDIPGYGVLDAVKGAAWKFNHEPAAALAVLLMSLGAWFAVGFVAGLLRTPGHGDAEEPVDRAEERVGRSLAWIALALAVVGTAAYGFVTGFAAVVVGVQARRHLVRGAQGRRLSGVAIALGTAVALVWITVLLTDWVPPAWRPAALEKLDHRTEPW